MLINLLPHRQWALTRKRQTWVVSLWLAAFVGVLLAAGISALQARQLAVQRMANRSLQQAIAGVDGRLTLKAQVKEDIEQLKLREKMLKNLRDNRQLTVEFLQEIAGRLPDGLHLTIVKKDGDQVRINGVARSNENVFELMRRMARGRQWLTQRSSTGGGKPFSLRATLRRPD
jgi:type IV pilus assembly protein PilN